MAPFKLLNSSIKLLCDIYTLKEYESIINKYKFYLIFTYNRLIREYSDYLKFEIFR